MKNQRKKFISESQIPEYMQVAFKKHKRGDFQGAEKIYKLVLDNYPTNPDALHLMGVITLNKGNGISALKYFSKALKKKPNDLKLWHSLGTAQFKMDRFSASIPSFEKVVKGRPDFHEAWEVLARAYYAVGNKESALDAIETAVRLDPLNVQYSLILADYLVDAGRIDEAKILFKRAYKTSPEHKKRAFIGLSDSMKFTKDDTEPEEMEPIAYKSVGVGVNDFNLLFAVGRGLESQGKYDRAFLMFQHAKKRKTIKYDRVKRHDYVEALKGIFNEQYIGERIAFGSDSRRPIFIVGMPRSGTTLTEQILTRHADIVGVGEQPVIRRYLRSIMSPEFAKVKVIEGGTNLRPGEIKKLYNHYIGVLNKHSRSAVRNADKLPHNFEALGLIAILFPNAKIINCTRDPMDNCLSCFTQNFTDFHDYNCDLKSLGHYYQTYRDIMNYWREILPIEIYDSSYEDLVSNQEEKTREMIAYLELDWDDACLTPQDANSLVSTPSRWQVRQPMYKTSVKKWKNYEKHLEPLKEALGKYYVED